MESRTIRMSEIEQRVLHSVQRDLLSPEMTALAVEAYHEEFAKGLPASAAVCRSDWRLNLPILSANRHAYFDWSKRAIPIRPLLARASTNWPLKSGDWRANFLCGRMTLDAIAVSDGGALFRDLVCQLREELGEGKDGEQEATSLVRGLVRRITVKPSARGKRQPIEVQAGSAPMGQSSNRDCIVGCGGWI